MYEHLRRASRSGEGNRHGGASKVCLAYFNKSYSRNNQSERLHFKNGARLRKASPEKYGNLRDWWRQKASLARWRGRRRAGQMHNSKAARQNHGHIIAWRNLRRACQ